MCHKIKVMEQQNITEKKIYKSIFTNEKYLSKIKEHHLEGHFFRYFNHHLPPFFFLQFKKKWQQQWYRNILYQRELETIANQCLKKRITPVILKGMALIDDLYPDIGSRHMSDIDIFIPEQDIKVFFEILNSLGHSMIKTDKWEADQFKYLFSKKIDQVEIILEVHTRYFYHLSMDISWETTKKEEKNLGYLACEYQLIYLVGHLAFQHSFLKLFWLVDVEHFILKNRDNIDWNKLYYLANKLKFKNSLKMALWALKKFFNLDLPQEVIQHYKLNRPYIWKLFLTKNFLWSARQFGLRYYMIKHLTYDSIWQSLIYDYLWCKRKISLYKKAKNNII